jgi:hypothetical protein
LIEKCTSCPRRITSTNPFGPECQLFVRPRLALAETVHQTQAGSKVRFAPATLSCDHVSRQ